MFLEFLWLDLAPVHIGFDAVLVALLRSTSVPFAMGKVTIQQACRVVILLHAEDMPHPIELGLDEGGFTMVQDFKVGDMILPTYSWYRPKNMHVEAFHRLNVTAVQCPRFDLISLLGG